MNSREKFVATSGRALAYGALALTPLALGGAALQADYNERLKKADEQKTRTQIALKDIHDKNGGKTVTLKSGNKVRRNEDGSFTLIKAAKAKELVKPQADEAPKKTDKK